MSRQLKQSEVRVPSGAVIAKEAAYHWRPLDAQGMFQLIPKGALLVDHAYQRETISKARVSAIASGFSWLAFGVLLVVQRLDGTLWVYDGQHRKLAADKRSDVDLLPCLVFSSESLSSEALAFLTANTQGAPFGCWRSFAPSWYPVTPTRTLSLNY